MLGSMLTGKGVIGVRKRVVRAGKVYKKMYHMDKNV